MARWPTCQYSNPNMSFAALSLNVQRVHDQIAAVLDKRIDGYNLSPSVVGGGLALVTPPTPPNGPPPPPVVTNPIGDDDTTCWIQKKGAADTPGEDKPGLEFVVDASDATYGRVCVVDIDDLTKQVGSLIPTREANPQFKIRANYGKASFGTSGAFDWELHRNGAASLADNGTSLSTPRNLDLTGGTAFRSRIDPGTPTGNTTSTLPNRDGAIVQAPVALTENALPRTDANGDVVDSAVADDGSAVRVSRTRLYFTNGSSGSIRGLENTGSPISLLGSDSATDGVPGGDVFTRGGDANTGNADGGAASLRAGNAAGTGTGGSLTTRAGTSASGTKGVWDLQTADGASRITVNADGSVTQAGDHTFSGTLTATADATLGNARFNSTTQTGADAGNYAVAATIATVFVNANAVTTNFDVTLPSAVTYANRRISVKITVASGTGGSLVTVKSAAGTVEGVAAGTGVPMDATARGRVTYQSDGTNWWSV